MKNYISIIITVASVIMALASKVEAREIKEVHFLNIPEETQEEVLQEPVNHEPVVLYDNIDMLAKCVEAEAGNQGLLGKRLVVDVILNRVDSDRFPNDVASVISQRGQFAVYPNAMSRVTVTQETLDAIVLELSNRTDSQILFFTAGRYNKYCIPAYQHGDHYFGY